MKEDRVFTFSLFRAIFDRFLNTSFFLIMVSFSRFFLLLIRRFPFVAFFLSLFVLFAIIYIGSVLHVPSEDVSEGVFDVVKNVDVSTVPSTPFVSVSGLVEKKGVVTIVSQVSGVVNRISVSAGSSVNRLTRLVSLSESYDGSVGASIAREEAQRRLSNTLDTFEKEMSILDDQRDSIPKTDSVDSEIARKQLTLSKHALELGRDLTSLDVSSARVDESLFAPVAPVSGVVERVFVRPGEVVSPGVPLVALRSDGETHVVARVSSDIARFVNVSMPSIFVIDGERFEVFPRYVSRDVVEAQSFVIVFVVDAVVSDRLSDGLFVRIDLPLENDESSPSPLVSLDAVGLTSGSAVVFVAQDGVARARQVVLGEVLGQYVRVREGLSESDVVILDRTVREGDRVDFSDSE
ncbi:MAG: hypothetical protein KC736_04820 [Candidatus Moranbacteria bacterium]|nr:hypothetical protein [Candidatus Moranbacteria bacterium]